MIREAYTKMLLLTGCICRFITKGYAMFINRDSQGDYALILHTMMYNIVNEIKKY